MGKAERLHFHYSLSCIGEGNGNPLQCSCLENPRDWGAWWAAVSGVAQSPTRLKRLSSSSSNPPYSISQSIKKAFRRASLPRLPRWLSGKESACLCRRHKRCGFNPWVGKIPPEKEMTTHSSTLAWRTPWTEEPGGLQCLWSQRSDMTTQLSMNSRATLMGSVVKNLPANAGDTGSIHDLGRSHMHQASKPVCRNY